MPAGSPEYSGTTSLWRTTSCLKQSPERSQPKTTNESLPNSKPSSVRCKVTAKMLSSINCGCWSGNTCANVHDTSDQSDALGTRSAIWLIATLTFASGLVVALSHARDGKVSV